MCAALAPSDDEVAVCSAYLKHRGVNGTIIFAMLSGSQAYNLAHANSDKDYLGIYMVDSRELLSIEGETKFPNQPLSTLPTEDTFPDTTLYEIKQFLKLVIKGNPFMVEALFTRQNYVSTECFDRLRLVRKSILSQQLVEEFLSYIRGQMVVHQRKGLKGKRVYHIIRLLFELNRIIRGEEPLIAFPDGKERDRLVELRQVSQPGEEVIVEAEEMIAKIEAQRPWNLPEECDDSCNQWLVNERVRLFENPGSA